MIIKIKTKKIIKHLLGLRYDDAWSSLNKSELGGKTEAEPELNEPKAPVDHMLLSPAVAGKIESSR